MLKSDWQWKLGYNSRRFDDFHQRLIKGFCWRQILQLVTRGDIPSEYGVLQLPSTIYKHRTPIFRPCNPGVYF